MHPPQTAAAGLLFANGPDAMNRVEAGARLTPWRGHLTEVAETKLGTVAAMGTAELGRVGAVTAAFQGRLDNLTAISVPGRTRAETVIDLYRSVGADFHDRLLGDFALIVVDEERNQVLGVRDWIAMRPLFFGSASGVTVMASEPKQVVEMLGIPRLPNDDTLAAYAQMERPALDATFLADVHAVLPNGAVRLTNDGTSTRRIPVTFPNHRDNASRAAETVRCLLEVAVSRRTQGATALGAMVSGGMDSTAVFGAASHLHTRGGPRVTGAYTMHFPAVPECDETSFARPLAEMWSVPWTAVAIEPMELDANLPQLLERHDGPGYPTLWYESEVLRRAGADGIDVMLGGQTGDHWFTDHPASTRLAIERMDAVAVLEWWRWHRRKGRPATRRLAGAAKSELARRVRRPAPSLFSARAAEFWLRLAFESEEREGSRLGMRIEHPLADRQFASYAAGLLPRHRFKNGLTKSVLRWATSELLPSAILCRQDKTNFEAALARGCGESANVTVTVARQQEQRWRQTL